MKPKRNLIDLINQLGEEEILRIGLKEALLKPLNDINSFDRFSFNLRNPYNLAAKMIKAIDSGINSEETDITKYYPGMKLIEITESDFVILRDIIENHKVFISYRRSDFKMSMSTDIPFLSIAKKPSDVLGFHYNLNKKYSLLVTRAEPAYENFNRDDVTPEYIFRNVQNLSNEVLRNNLIDLHTNGGYNSNVQ